MCAACKDDDKKNLLICDRDGCGKVIHPPSCRTLLLQAYHLKCVKSPLVVVPRAFWLCPPCQATAERAEEQGFGYPDGSTFNLCKYEKQASGFKKTFFGDKNPTVNEIEVRKLGPQFAIPRDSSNSVNIGELSWAAKKTSKFTTALTWIVQRNTLDSHHQCVFPLKSANVASSGTRINLRYRAGM